MANRYWVGGSGTWDATSTTNWSASSGGASGASVPGASDTAVFDQATTYTVTFSIATLAVQGIENTAGTVTFAGTITTSATLSNLTLAAAAVWSSASTLTLGGSGSFTLNTNNVSMNASVTVNSSSGSWTLASAFRHATAKVFTLTAGSLDLASYTLTTPSFLSNNTNTRTLAFGTGKLIINGSSAGTIVAITSTNLTTSGSKRMDVTRTAGTCTINPGVSDLDMYVTSGSYSLALASSSSIGVLDTTGYTGALTLPSFFTIRGNIVLGPASTTVSGTGTTTLGGTSGTKTITSNGVVINVPITVSAGTGTWQLVDAMSVGPVLGRTAQLSEGTLDLNNQTLTAGQFISSGSLTRVLAMGTGKLSLTGGMTVLGTVSAFSMTGTGTIEFTGSAFRTLAGGGYQNYPAVTHTGTGQLNITGSNKFTSLSVTPTTGNVLLFESGSSNYFVSSFNISGAAGTLATLGATTTAQAVLRKSGTWFMGANSVDSGNNTGLTFTAGGTLDYLDVSYISGLGPPTTYSSSVTESATALDATSSIKTIERTVADTVNAADQMSTITPFDSFVVDTATALDSVGATETNPASVSETATALDAAAAGSFSVSSVADTATALDAPSATFAFVRAVADTATAQDASTAATTANVSTTDNATASEVVSATETNPASVSETATAQESLGVTNLAVAATSETATALDTTVSNFAIPTAITESATALDTIASSKTLPSNVADSTTAAEILATTAAFFSTTTDAAQASEVTGALRILVAVVADTATGADAVNVSFAVNSAVSETLNAFDATGGNIILLVSASLVEGATVADAPLVLPSSFTVVMVEGAAAQDLARGTTVFPASFSDGVLVIDVATARYLWNLIDDSQTANWQNVGNAQTPNWQNIIDVQSPGWTLINQ